MGGIEGVLSDGINKPPLLYLPPQCNHVFLRIVLVHDGARQKGGHEHNLGIEKF